MQENDCHSAIAEDTRHIPTEGLQRNLEFAPVVQAMYHSCTINAYAFDPLFTLDLEHYISDLSGVNVVFGIGNISGRLIQHHCNVFLEFEEPNFLVKRDLLEYVDRTAALDLKLTLCPYTARLFNAHIGRDVVQPMFFPTNHEMFLRELGEPDLDAKSNDVVYVGCSNQAIIGKFRERSTADPHMPNYLDKIRHLYASKIAICHNLLFYDEGSDDKRVLDELIPEFRRSPTTVPQLKSRMFEAGFSKCIPLVYYDDYNVATDYFTPNVDFLFFHNLDELDATIARIVDHYDDYRFIADNVYRKCCANYTMTHFVDRYLRTEHCQSVVRDRHRQLRRPPRRRCIILTTIYPVNAQIEFYSRQAEGDDGWDFIVVGDAKTDVYDYLWRKRVPCIFLDLDRQRSLYPTLFDLIPLNSYARKMFGYLYAIQHGYEVIYETDDDNLVNGDTVEIPTCARTCVVQSAEECGSFLNVYKMYTDADIWARGIPPGHAAIRAQPVVLREDKQPHSVDVAVIQGLVDGDPDVDAVYRIAHQDNPEPFFFDRSLDLGVRLAPGAVCPFNTQNTFWTDPTMFYAMYLPITVSFRYTDILRGVIALFQLWKHDKTLMFTYPTAVQERNPHDLTKDLESEQSMYATMEQVVALLQANPEAELEEVYGLLCEEGIVTPGELVAVTEWLRLVRAFQIR